MKQNSHKTSNLTQDHVTSRDITCILSSWVQIFLFCQAEIPELNWASLSPCKQGHCDRNHPLEAGWCAVHFTSAGSVPCGQAYRPAGIDKAQCLSAVHLRHC